MSSNLATFAGAFMGVIASVATSLWVTQKQALSDRQLQYREREHQAAAVVLSRLLDIPDLINYLMLFEQTGNVDYDAAALTRVRKETRPLSRTIHERGSALPVPIRLRLEGIGEACSKLVEGSYDPYENPLYARLESVEFMDYDAMEKLEHDVEQLIRELRALAGVPGKNCQCSCCHGQLICCHGMAQESVH